MIGDAFPREGGLEQLRLRRAEKPRHGDRCSEIGEDAGHVHPLAPGVRPALRHPVHPACGEARDAQGLVDRRLSVTVTTVPSLMRGSLSR